MPELIRDLESLVTAWREWVAKAPASDPFSRQAGYESGLKLCANQVEDIIRRAVQDA